MQDKIRRGNSTEVDPRKKVSSEYVTNAVTVSNRKKNETPIVDDQNVALARDFSQENKK